MTKPIFLPGDTFFVIFFIAVYEEQIRRHFLISRMDPEVIFNVLIVCKKRINLQTVFRASHHKVVIDVRTEMMMTLPKYLFKEL